MKFFWQNLFASGMMAVGWGALLWSMAGWLVGLSVGLLMFVVFFVSFYAAELGPAELEKRNRRFDD